MACRILNKRIGCCTHLCLGYSEAAKQVCAAVWFLSAFFAAIDTFIVIFLLFGRCMLCAVRPLHGAKLKETDLFG